MKIFNYYFRIFCKIEFRDISDLSRIIYSYSTGSLKLEPLCAASPSTLLFVDKSKGPRDVYWLDCSEAEPKLTGKKISTDANFIYEICFTPDKMKPLVVAASLSSLYAYNAVNNKLEWNCKVKSFDVTTDGEYILARTENGVHTVSRLDGKHLGCLVRNGDQGLGSIYNVQWCNSTSSLIVAHEVNNEYYISSIQFE